MGVGVLNVLPAVSIAKGCCCFFIVLYCIVYALRPGYISIHDAIFAILLACPRKVTSDLSPA